MGFFCKDCKDSKDNKVSKDGSLSPSLCPKG